MAHRFFIPQNWIIPPTVRLRDQTARQIRTVLRMQSGDEIIVLDNSGTEWRVALTKIGKDAVEGQIVAQHPAQGEPALHLTLYQGTLKAQKFEWILQKGTELGISCFVPTICRRSVVRQRKDLAKKQARWEHIIREAAEQSGRGKLPRLEAAMPLADALIQAQSKSLVIMPWEEAAGATLKEVLRKAQIKNKKSPHPPTPSPSLGEGETGAKRRARVRASIALFIGPEGGFAADEVNLARQAGVKVVKLGPRILRAETAGPAACVAILYELDEWG